MPTNPRRARATARRVVRWLVVLLVALWALYLLSANAFLNLGGVEKAFASTDQVMVSYRRAWTVVPGRVHVRDFRLVFSDYNVQFSLDIERADLSVRLHALASKTFRVDRVEGSGLVLRFRHRVDPGDAALMATRALPPIPELLTPAVFEPLAPAVRRERYWTVHLENVDMGVSELWVQQFRYLGAGRARGAFRLVAGERLWVGRRAEPATLTLAPGRVSAGPFAVAEGFAGSVGCVVDPFHVLVPVGLQPLRFIDVEAALAAPRAWLDVVSLFGHERGLSAASEPGELDLRLDLDHGEFRPASRALFRAPRVMANHPEWSATSEALELSLAPSPGGQSEAHLRVRSAGLDRPARPGPPLVSGPISVVATSTTSEVDADWSLAALELAAAEVLVPDLRWFDDLARKHRLRIKGGSVSLAMAGRWEPGLISGMAQVRGRALGVASGALEVELEGRMLADAREARLDRRSGRLELGLDLERLALGRGRQKLELARMSADARLALERFRGRGALRLEVGSVTASSGSLGVAAKAKLDADVVIRDARNGEAEISTRGRAERIALQSAGMRASLGVLRLESHWLRSASSVDGWLHAKAGRVTARAGSLELGAKPELLLHAQGLDLARDRGVFRGWLGIADFTSVDRRDGARCQSASVELASVFAESRPDRGGRRSRLELFARDARARWDDFTASGALRLSARRDAHGRLEVDALASDLRLASGAAEKEGWAAQARRLGLRARLSSHAGQLSGAVRASAARVSGRIGETPVHGDVSLDWQLSRLDPKRREAIGRAALAIEDAGVDGGEVETRGWWASLQLPALQVVARDDLSFFGSFEARMRDGLPGLAVLSDRGDVPDWLPRVMPLDPLRAEGVLARSCRLTDVLFTRVSGVGLLASGRIQSVPDDVRSAFLVQVARVSPVRVGLVNYGDEVEAAVFAGSDWLREQYDKLDEHAAMRELLGCPPPPKIERCGRAQ